MQRLSRLVTFCAAAALIAACGSSNDGDAPPAGVPAAVVPTITQQPANAAVTEGQPASFAVAATGTGPLTYQWQRNGADVAGANAASYTTAATVIGDSGATFRALVSNSAGSAASDSASLIVNAAGMLPALVGYFKASNTGAGDGFGERVALSGNGNFMAVSAPTEDSGAAGVDGDQNSNALGNSGAVYIFMRSAGGVWSQQAYLKASNPGADDRFGDSVALSFNGTVLVVGAASEDSAATGVNGDGANNAASNSGAAYVFVRDGSTWSQQAYLKPSNTDANDAFGVAVAVNPQGDTVAIGALGEASAATGINGDGSSNAAPQSGAVYVFARAGVTWSQQAYIKASNPDPGDWFGFSVSLDGSGLLAVGAVGEDSSTTGVNSNAALADNGAGNSGAAYLFGFNAQGVWVPLNYFKASNTGENDGFGVSVALSGGTLAVGAFGESSAATGVNGNQASDAAIFSGAVYVFVENGSLWSQQAYLKASNTGADDGFGLDVAVSGDGNRLAVGAPNESSSATGVGGDQANNGADESGAAYVFVRNGSVWSQLAYVKASNTGIDDAFGWHVALSDDGLTLAVSGPGEDSAATGINGDAASNAASNAGAVYVY